MGSVVSRLHNEEVVERGQNEQAKSPATFPGDNPCLPSLLISPGLWEKRGLKRELILILLVFMAEGTCSQLVCLGSSPPLTYFLCPTTKALHTK